MLEISPLQRDKGHYYFQILNQDGRGLTFKEFTASNGVRIKSSHTPAISWGTNSTTFWVRGRANRDDNRKIPVTPKVYEMVRQAVDEYNGLFVSIKLIYNED